MKLYWCSRSQLRIRTSLTGLVINITDEYSRLRNESCNRGSTGNIRAILAGGLPWRMSLEVRSPRNDYSPMPACLDGDAVVDCRRYG